MPIPLEITIGSHTTPGAPDYDSDELESLTDTDNGSENSEDAGADEELEAIQNRIDALDKNKVPSTDLNRRSFPSFSFNLLTCTHYICPQRFCERI